MRSGARALRPAPQVDLFGSSPLPGLAHADDILSDAEEASLIAKIAALDLKPFQFQQWEGKRLTRSFGWTYDFQTGRFAPSDPIPEWLMPVRERAARFAGLAPADLVHALVIEYGVGAGIGWHKDRPVFEHVLGISLGAATTMRFRRRIGASFERVSVPLAARSIYHLDGEARTDWEHSIADMPEPRWSLTFRSLR
ncbi:alpha-ketoglutarate-dependent dioxygenase AlkB [Nostoc sp. XA010]|nr:alpha-ketoglutarate-dependent dioxygenase AlkB [Nostoc sp. CHAB 5844]MCC5662034.1 alpha-ketoglutarate-dependent dioxygenase AlkB [Nostoc sp. XA010]